MTRCLGAHAPQTDTGVETIDLAFATTAERQHAVHPVAVRSLTLTAFRTYETVRVEVGPDPVVLTGPNGAGKTNLLEAVSYLSPAVDCVARGWPIWHVAATPGRGRFQRAFEQRVTGRSRSAPVLTPNRSRANAGSCVSTVRVHAEPAALAEVFSMILADAGHGRPVPRIVIGSAAFPGPTGVRPRPAPCPPRQRL